MRNLQVGKRAFWVILLFVAILYSPNAWAQKQEITKIFLVRHAEKKKDGSKDPGLTTVGKQRAMTLSKMLQKVDLAAVYSTDYKRTKNTGKPTADSKKMKIELYNPMDSRKFIDNILEKHLGKSVLVVGHSNTIPLLVNTLLGEEKYDALKDDDYDNLFIVSILHGTDSEVIQLTFEP